MAALAAFDFLAVLQRIVHLAEDACELHHGVGGCAFQSVQGDPPGGPGRWNEDVSKAPRSGRKRLGDHRWTFPWSTDSPAWGLRESVLAAEPIGPVPRHRQGFWVCAAGTCFETVSKARTGMPP